VDESFQPANWHYFTSGPLELSENDIVADCGAAEGLFSFVAAQKARKVHAIEPIPKWLPALDQIFRTMVNVEIMPVALGHRQGTLRMTDDEIYSRVSATGALEIPVKTVDSLFYDRGMPLTFIKADVEGYEFQLLLGAVETIRHNHPRLSLTVYHDQNHFAEIADFLRQIHSDYRISFRGIAANGNPVLLQAY
jgi:FkbM family methyltransferase